MFTHDSRLGGPILHAVALPRSCENPVRRSRREGKPSRARLLSGTSRSDQPGLPFPGNRAIHAAPAMPIANTAARARL